MRILQVGLSASLAGLMLAAAPTTSTTRPVKDISGLVAGVLKGSTVPGLAGAVVELDGVTSLGVAGIRKTGSPAKIARGDLFHLGSDTKSMTALLIGQLIDEKKLKFESTLGELFPEAAAKANADTAKITVRQLLEHRGGMVPNLDWREFQALSVPMLKKRAAVVAKLLGEPPAYPPGSKFEYSNTGYVLLGAIVESIEKKSWEEVMRAKLWGPLGIKSGGFGPVPVTGQPWGHVKDGDKLKPVQGDNAPVMGPAGTAYASMEDWGKYVALCLRASKGDTPLISSATYQQLVTPEGTGGYAGGWLVSKRSWAGGKTLSHNGSNTMWYCTAWLAPDKGFAFLAATNTADPEAGKACEAVVGALIKHRESAAK